MTIIKWRDHIFFLTIFTLTALGVSAYAYWSDNGGNSVALLLSLVTSVVSAVGAAKSAAMAGSMETRMARGERVHAVRELVRSWTRATASIDTAKGLRASILVSARAISIRYGVYADREFKLVEESVAKEAATYEDIHTVLETIPANPTGVSALSEDQVAIFQIKLDAINVSLEAGNANLLREAMRNQEEERFSRMAPGVQ